MDTQQTTTIEDGTVRSAETFAALVRRRDANGIVAFPPHEGEERSISRILTADGVAINFPASFVIQPGDTIKASISDVLVKPMLSPYEVQQGWQDMSTAPRDGTRFQLLLCGLNSAARVEQGGFYYGETLMGSRDERVLRGNQNVLSPSLQPVGWRIEEKASDV